MSISFSTADPEALLAKFNTAIEQREQKGKIQTWERSADKQYYTHKAPDWHRKAWFKPRIEAERLVFNIIKPQNADVTSVTYGYYHGHLIETFLNHFDSNFANGSASALPTANDNVSS
ncbi:hypothetical protein [Bradyrhizobium sp. SBR1B]|uniref:hypothetical protein n=1 Tax=Bradyrhizobium sp. SBR1B TaxID=2663836 RepID=UPI001605D1A0|nr:hypothetical protein [Bradyrhizobium sp. SBR1B]MBB4378365.1 hypothetical protein [Bradyrhizobium sp. SBR1B]